MEFYIVCLIFRTEKERMVSKSKCLWSLTSKIPQREILSKLAFLFFFLVIPSFNNNNKNVLNFFRNYSFGIVSLITENSEKVSY